MKNTITTYFYYKNEGENFTFHCSGKKTSIKCVIITLILLFANYGAIGQNADNKFNISVGELEKQIPEAWYGGASRKMYFKDTTFTLDYMNIYSISYDGSLAAVKWYEEDGGSTIITYDTLGIEVSRCSNLAKNPRSINLFNNGYFAVFGGDSYEQPNEKYFYLFDNKGVVFYESIYIFGFPAIILPPDSGNSIALITLDSLSNLTSFNGWSSLTPYKGWSSRIDLIQNVNDDPLILSSDIIEWPDNLCGNISLHLKYDLKEISVIYKTNKFKRIHSLNYRYDSISIKKAKKYSKTLRH